MSQKTIQCRLVAPVETRQYLWTLAAEKNTPLTNALLIKAQKAYQRGVLGLFWP